MSFSSTVYHVVVNINMYFTFGFAIVLQLTFMKQVRPIWKGQLTNVVHNVELCWIIERLHRWAIHHLRPWLSSCIDAWNIYVPEEDELEESELEKGALEEGELEKGALEEGELEEDESDEDGSDEDGSDEDGSDEDGSDEDESDEDESEEGEVIEDVARQVRKANTSKAGAGGDMSENVVDELQQPPKLKRQGTAASVVSVWARSTAKLFQRGSKSNGARKLKI